MTLSSSALTSQLGGLLVIGNVFLDQLGVPIPAVPVLLLAGASLPLHPWWGAEVVVGSMFAVLAADMLWYLTGRRHGGRVTKLLCRISLTPDSCVNDTHRRFERWGGNAIVFAKFVPGLGLMAPPLAGALRMSIARFIALSAVAAALWIGVHLLAGMLFRSQIEWGIAQARGIAGPPAVALVVALAAYLAFRWWRRRRETLELRSVRISVGDLVQRLQAATQPLIVDVRAVGARTLDPRQIPLAIFVPLDELEAQLERLPRDREIVAYCSCPSEASAARFAHQLTLRGYTTVHVLDGGLDAWVAAGHATVPIAAETRTSALGDTTPSVAS